MLHIHVTFFYRINYCNAYFRGLSGDDNECIGPEAFLDVCTSYGLVKIVSLIAH